jgi:hypothetical protein
MIVFSFMVQARSGTAAVGGAADDAARADGCIGHDEAVLADEGIIADDDHPEALERRPLGAQQPGRSIMGHEFGAAGDADAIARDHQIGFGREEVAVDHAAFADPDTPLAQPGDSGVRVLDAGFAGLQHP